MEIMEFRQYMHRCTRSCLRIRNGNEILIKKVRGQISTSQKMVTKKYKHVSSAIKV